MSVGTGIFCSHCVRAATVVRSDVSFRTRWFVRESIHSFTFFIRRGCRTNIEQACREAPARALGVNLTFTSLEGQRYSFFISFVRYKIPKILDLMTIPFLIEKSRHATGTLVQLFKLFEPFYFSLFLRARPCKQDDV